MSCHQPGLRWDHPRCANEAVDFETRARTGAVASGIGAATGRSRQQFVGAGRRSTGMARRPIGGLAEEIG